MGLLDQIRRLLCSPNMYRVLVVFSSIVWLQHYLWIVGTTAGWGSEASKPPGLWVYSLISPLLVTSILALAVWIAPRRSLLVALTPAILFLLTWFLMLRVLPWQAPSDFYDGFYPADNIPQIWLFIGSAVATVFLLLFALGVRWARRGT